MAAPDALPQLDSWPAIFGFCCAAVAALLVPLTGFVKTLLEYRAEVAKAEKLKPEVARDVAQATGGALFDSMAIADLAAAVKGLTAAILADTASDEAHHADQIARRLDLLTDELRRRDAGQPKEGR